MIDKNNGGDAPRVAGLHAVVLIAGDFAGQVNFYKEVMGFTPIAEYPDAVFFSIGAQKLALFAKGHHPEGDANLDGAHHGLSHLEFSIAKGDRATMEGRLKAAGAHAYRDNFRDADGNLFHFVV